MRRAVFAFVSAALVFSAAGEADTGSTPPQLPERLTAVRHSIEVTDREIGGEGAGLLRAAIASAKYIVIGEDHVTQEIPRFVARLCDLVPAADLSALFLEVGPEAATIVDRTVRSKGRIARMAALNQQYPSFVAFLDTRDDNDMAAHCAASSRDPDFHILGLDQEYVGSPGFLLDLVLKEKLSALARARVRMLRAEEADAVRRALASGNASDLLMMTVTDAQLKSVQDALTQGSSQRAKGLFAALRTSADIYRKNRLNTPDSNQVRALLMKRTLDALPRPRGKAIFKFGDWHLYKGVNPLGERDLGNHVAEAAEGRGETSLHILVLGAKGIHAFPARFGQPLARQPFRMDEDRDYRWLKLAVDRQLPDGWTLFDLRELRHKRIGGIDQDWRRVIDGYDLMVVIPDLTPSETIMR